jgi:hypothetical protein
MEPALTATRRAAIQAQEARMEELRALYRSLYPPPVPPKLMPTPERLSEWFSKLDRRVKEIEADDGAMGRTEAKRWADELEGFRREFA